MACPGPFRRSSTEPSVPSSAVARLMHRHRAPKPSHRTLSSALSKDRLRDHTCCASSCNKGVVLSPGHESVASSNRSSSSSSFLLHKIHLWSISCFCSRGLHYRGFRPSAVSEPAPPLYPRREPWDPGLSSRREEWMPRRSSSPPPAVRPVERPLRESEPVPARPAPAITMIARPIPLADDAIGTVGSRKDRESTVVISTSSPTDDGFVWAQKYRPKALKEFICNRDRADELLQMVSLTFC